MLFEQSGAGFYRLVSFFHNGDIEEIEQLGYWKPISTSKKCNYNSQDLKKLKNISISLKVFKTFNVSTKNWLEKYGNNSNKI